VSTPDVIRRHVLRQIAPISIPVDIRRTLRLPVLAVAVSAEARTPAAAPTPAPAAVLLVEAA
jgi:hypothetical protein